MTEQRVIPMLTYEDVARAADWIGNAFGFEETGRWSDDQGRVTHVNMELDGGVFPGIGQRQYRAEDVEGHRWMFASPL